MSGAAGTIIAVLAGLAAAFSFGVGVALQHRQAQLAPASGRAPFRLLAHLARQRLWLAGIALNATAYGLQALALAFGPLALVAPIAVTDLLFALPLAARWSRRPMRAVDWAGCILAGGGGSPLPHHLTTLSRPLRRAHPALGTGLGRGSAGRRGRGHRRATHPRSRPRQLEALGYDVIITLREDAA